MDHAPLPRTSPKMDADGMRGDLEFGTLPGMLALSATRFGPLEAIIDEPVRVSYADLQTQVTNAAKALLGLGILHGDRVAIWAPNLWEWIVAALAVHSVGAVLVPINTRFKGAEAAYVLHRSGARALFTVNGFLGIDTVAALRQSGADLPELETVVVMRGTAPAGTHSWPDFLLFGKGVTSEEVQARAQAVAGSDLCDLIFTSGTTGYPKGVMATHAQTLRAFRDWAEVVGLEEGDRYLVVVPFFHSFGYKAGWLAALMRGAVVIPQPVFEVGAVLEQVSRHRISVLPGPPTLYQSILSRADRDQFDLSSLRLAVTGAAVVPVELILRMRRELTFQTIITAYGLTEATGVSTMCRADDPPELIATTSGRAIPGVEVKVAEDAGQEVPRGEPGEVLIRGYSVMPGYFENPEQTRATLEPDGWLHTGDIGVMDAQGYLRITDRKKDMFIVGGFNVYPAEIEGVLLSHPAVAQVAVVGAPDERLGEVGVAFVVPRVGAAVTPEALLAFSRERMANYKVPRRFECVEALPLNATGKVLKYQLRARVRGL